MLPQVSPPQMKNLDPKKRYDDVITYESVDQPNGSIIPEQLDLQFFCSPNIQEARDSAEKMRMDAANLAQQLRIERNLEEFNRYNKYLEEYYNDESLRKMSSSVREVVQEWMDMNK